MTLLLVTFHASDETELKPAYYINPAKFGAVKIPEGAVYVALHDVGMAEDE